jgi:hypothetical protein
MTTDPRAAFEAHFQLSQRQAKRDNAGEYIHEYVRARWEGWQAAMAQQTTRAVGVAIQRYEFDQSRECGYHCQASMTESPDGDYVLWADVVPLLTAPNNALLPYLRQYRHNDGSEGFVFAYDLEGINREFALMGKDALRYRWLRTHSAGQWQHPIVVSQQRNEYNMNYVGPLIGGSLDKAIDAAMQECA